MQDVSGKLKLNFKDPEAVRLLAVCCLKKDFNLDVEIPPDKLMPTLPLRINYILWIEDLLSHCGLKENVIGVDIGTGACCIYCLLSVRMNNWKMYGLEIDKEIIQHARNNVTRNQLDENITVVDQEGSDRIFDKLFLTHSEKMTFTMCNPPFYASKDQMIVGENRTGKRRKLDQLSPMRESSETVFLDGGELGFVTKILQESIELRDKIEIYSTMFGCKKNFRKFINLLKDHKINNYTTTELVQGKTFRWTIAWSFCKKLTDFKMPHLQQKGLPSKVLTHVIENAKLERTHEKLLNTLKNLKITIKPLEQVTNSTIQYELEMTENTWSSQRKKRRAQERNETFQEPAASKTAPIENLRAGLEIKKTNDNAVQISLFFISGTMSKDCVNQILQFIKNN